MSIAFAADLCRDPRTNDLYVLIMAEDGYEPDTNARIWEPLEYAGPLSEDQLTQIKATRATDGLDWSEDLPEGWDIWEPLEQLWLDLGGDEP